MNNIQTQFSIKDLENLSGILAHTIRIWEKRYGLLEPKRTESNIRYYDIYGLQKLLNVTLLYNSGYKISKIAHLNHEQLRAKVLEQEASSKDFETYANSLKLVMFKFDTVGFNDVYNRMLNTMDFRQIFCKIFIPFLNNVGLDWQSDIVTPAHEHFMSNLILQKLQVNIEYHQKELRSTDKVYVLFLPVNEIHEFGLLYIHYELLSKGYNSIYLGASVPLDNLFSLQALYPEIKFVSYFTVRPSSCDVNSYLKVMSDNFLVNGNTLSVLGQKVCNNSELINCKGVKIYNDINELINVL